MVSRAVAIRRSLPTVGLSLRVFLSRLLISDWSRPQRLASSVCDKPFATRAARNRSANLARVPSSIRVPCRCCDSRHTSNRSDTPSKKREPSNCVTRDKRNYRAVVERHGGLRLVERGGIRTHEGQAYSVPPLPMHRCNQPDSATRSVEFKHHRFELKIN